jgi:endogenous inhibitor of DNA gyrase (YacG/DUF329 family)
MGEQLSWWAVRCPICSGVRVVRARELGETAGPHVGQVSCPDCRTPVLLEENEVFLFDQSSGKELGVDSSDQLSA